MSRIDTALKTARARPLIVPFVTAGFPERSSTPEIVAAMANAGADMIEIGIPFSDPLADGPVIQAASTRALSNGMTLTRVLAQVRAIRGSREADEVPILLMGYCNPLFRYGIKPFARDAAAAGVDGLIVPDLPPGEAGEYRHACAAAGLSTVFLIAPNTSDARIAEIDSASTHFSYCVSITGVTGSAGVGDQTTMFLDRVAAVASKPFVVGFGIKSAEHVRSLGSHAAGVVVGTALIEAIDRAEDPAAAAADMVGELRRAAETTARAESVG